MKYAGENFTPYSDGGDKFVERFGDFTSRLQFSAEQDHWMFDPMPSATVLESFYNGTFIRSAAPPTPEDEFTPAIIDVMRGFQSYIVEKCGLPRDFSLHDVGCGFGAGVWGGQKVGIRATGNEANRDWVEIANPHCNGALSADPPRGYSS